MFEQTLPISSAADDLVLEKLPPVLRIQSITRLPFDGKHVLWRATHFHERATLTVEWLSRHVDVRLTSGSVVSVRWQGRPVSTAGAVRIARMVLLERPDPALNLFETIPYAWLRDRSLVQRAARLWDALPRAFQHLFTAVF